MHCSTGSLLIGLLSSDQYEDSGCWVYKGLCVLWNIRQHFFSDLLTVSFKLKVLLKPLITAIPLIFFLPLDKPVPSRARRGLHPKNPLIITGLLARWCLNSAVRVNKQCCRVSTRPGGSFTAPSVDITALLSEECKAQPHSETLCQNKYSKEIETTLYNTNTHTHTLTVRVCVAWQYKAKFPLCHRKQCITEKCRILK